MNIEEILKNYGNNISIKPDEVKIRNVIEISKRAFCKSEEEKTNSYFEFLFEQSQYIKKSWWFLQAAILFLFWLLAYTADQSELMQRNMGIFSSFFVIIMIPEFWKNKSTNSFEIEGCTYYSLRQIYSARLVLFAIVDIILLSVFIGVISLTTRITIFEILIQFLLPFNINCCMCCRILYSKGIYSEYFAVGVSILWSVIWTLLIWQENIYNLISIPIWIMSLIFSAAYLVYSIYNLLDRCENYWEVNSIWN